jgi:hypothetical protein
LNDKSGCADTKDEPLHDKQGARPSTSYKTGDSPALHGHIHIGGLVVQALHSGHSLPPALRLVDFTPHGHGAQVVTGGQALHIGHSSPPPLRLFMT